MLAIGVSATVAAAWACALRSNTSEGYYVNSTTSGVRGLGVTLLAAEVGKPAAPSELPTAVSQRFSCGWPFECLTCFRTCRAPTYSEEFMDAWRAPNWLGESPCALMLGGTYLPLRPMPIGFACNCLVFSAIAFMPISGVGAIRRMLRRRAGRCVKCGYDRRGLADAACPECGAAPTQDSGLRT